MSCYSRLALEFDLHARIDRRGPIPLEIIDCGGPKSARARRALRAEGYRYSRSARHWYRLT